MAVTQSTVTMTDGTKLVVRIGSPAAEPRGTVLMLHGGGEHAGRYPHIVDRWVVRGWRCVFPDLRGHGLSDGPRWDVRHVDQYLDDLRLILRELAVDPESLCLFGHSFGGLLAARWVQQGCQPRALALSAPLFGLSVHVPRWKIVLGHVVAPFLPQLRFRTKLDPRNMTRDPQFLAARQADPYIQRQVTVRWFFAMRRALRQAFAEVGRVTCPTLIVQGTADRTVDPLAAERWIEQVAATEKEFIRLPDQVHELLNETAWARTADMIISWFDQHVDRRKTR